MSGIHKGPGRTGGCGPWNTDQSRAGAARSDHPSQATLGDLEVSADLNSYSPFG